MESRRLSNFANMTALSDIKFHPKFLSTKKLRNLQQVFRQMRIDRRRQAAKNDSVFSYLMKALELPFLFLLYLTVLPAI